IEIDDALADPGKISSGVVDGERRTPSIVYSLLLVMLTAAATVFVIQTVFVVQSRSQPASPGRSVIRFHLDLPADVELYAGHTQSVALSPDGTRAASIGITEGVRQIYLRRLDQFEAVPLRGTENANACFFSPDGQSLGFLTSGGLRLISLVDGRVFR